MTFLLHVQQAADCKLPTFPMYLIKLTQLALHLWNMKVVAMQMMPIMRCTISASEEIVMTNKR